MTVGPGRGRRAPRLRADERIARHITRRGRFKAIDPTRARSLPTLPRIVAALGWAVLLGESLRRAYRAVGPVRTGRRGAEAGGGSG